MSVTKLIRYKTKPECAEENERLIQAVFAELAAENPEGLRYASFRGEDGVSFLHVAVLEDAGHNPLLETAAFREFTSDIAARCAEAPVTTDAKIVGSYRLVSAD